MAASPVVGGDMVSDNWGGGGGGGQGEDIVL